MSRKRATTNLTPRQGWISSSLPRRVPDRKTSVKTRNKLSTQPSFISPRLWRLPLLLISCTKYPFYPAYWFLNVYARYDNTFFLMYKYSHLSSLSILERTRTFWWHILLDVPEFSFTQFIDSWTYLYVLMTCNFWCILHRGSLSD